MSAYIPAHLRAQVQEADRNCCAYCLTSETNSGIPSACDHIQPRSKGGKTEFENLCQACRPYNEFKGNITEAIDPVSGEMVPLFNPRTQLWVEHFEWNFDGTRIIGLTHIGRATVVALQMNNPTIMTARRRWVIAGWHPPEN
jgi:hypothetical protein